MMKTIKELVLAGCCILILNNVNPVAVADSQKNGSTRAEQTAEQKRKAGDLSFTPVKLELDGKPLPAELGRLVVRESRRGTNPNLIEVAFSRIKTTSSQPNAPLVYLTGGPGQSATNVLRFPDFLRMFVGLSESRDVILLDIRGAGLSTPNLLHRAAQPLTPQVFRDQETALLAFKERARAAADHFRSEGIELAAYNTEEAADDIEDLRKALGVKKLDLLGYSYGTHLALATIRRHEEHINRAVLIGTEGPNHTLKFPSTAQKQLAELAKMVAGDPVVGQKVPNLIALLERVLNRLEKHPITLRIGDEKNKQEGFDVEVTKFVLQVILEQDLGDTNDLPIFPALLHTIEQGDHSLLKRFVERRFRRRQGFPVLKDIMDQASGATRERLLRIEDEAKSSLLGNVMNFPHPEIGEAYGYPDLGDEFRSPVISNVPTLFISGTLDANTPPFQAEEVRRGFKKSTHLIMENAGHENMFPNEAVQHAILDFLRGKDVSKVKITLPALKFIPITQGT